jgi:branched-subunit amino acid permease
MKQHLWAAMLLMTALAGLDVVALLALQMTGETWPDLLAAAALGLAFGQGSLTALYFAFGRSNIAFRAAVFVAICGAMGYLGSRAVDREFGMWWTLMLLTSTPLLIGGGIARLLGVQFVHDSDTPEPRLQFSIVWLISLTTACALLVAVARYLPPPGGRLPKLAYFCLLMNVSPAVASLAAGCIKRLRYSLPLLVFALPACGALVGFSGIFYLWPTVPFGELAFLGTLQGFVVFVSLCVLKATGYRVRFAASPASRVP